MLKIVILGGKTLVLFYGLRLCFMVLLWRRQKTKLATINDKSSNDNFEYMYNYPK